MALKEILSEQLHKLYPDMKPYLCERYATKYTEEVLKELRSKFVKYQNRNEQISFSLTDCTTNCGQFKLNGEKKWLFPFMQKSASLRLIEVMVKGQVGMVTRVQMNPKYRDLIMEELIDTPISEEVVTLPTNINVTIPIDYASLSDFIEKTRETLNKTSQRDNYYDKLHTNILKARDLMLSAEKVKNDLGEYYLSEEWITADTGRRYATGLSLQTQSKEVRHAALGHCHMYDFQAHSYAVMLSVARKIDPQIKSAAIEDYIRYRTPIRERIARDVNINVEVIKQVFTALGFNARPVNNPYTAIRKMFKDESRYLKLLDQPDFKFIREDFERINRVILDKFPTKQDFTWLDGYSFTAKSDNCRGFKSDSQKLAWIYQNAEAHITNWFIRIVREYTQQEPLLTVHDCVYYKQPIPSETLKDAQVIIREQFAHIKMAHTIINPIGTQERYDQLDALADGEEALHKQRIWEEEQLARGYKSTVAESQSKKEIQFNHVEHRIEQHRWNNQPDFTEYEYELPNYR